MSIRSMMVALAVLAGGFSSASADVVAKLVRSGSNEGGNVVVNDDGTIEVSRRTNFADGYGASYRYGATFYAPLLKNGICKVERYGGGLGNLPDITTDCDQAGSVVVTPDGKYCFVCARNNSASKTFIWRYALANGTTGEWEEFATVPGETVPRTMCCDESGHLFIALRNLKKINCYDVEDGSKPLWSQDIKIGTGTNGPTGLCWNPQDNYLYCCGSSWNDVLMARIRVDGDVSTRQYATMPVTSADAYYGWGVGLAVVNGTLYYVAANGSGNQPKAISRFRWPLADESFTCIDTIVPTGTLSTAPNGLSVAYDIPSAKFDFTEADARVMLVSSMRIATLETKPEYGQSSGALVAGGAMSRAMLVDSATLIPATGDFTLSFWVQAPAGNAVRCLLSNDNGQAGAFSLTVAADNTVGLSFAAASGAAAIAGSGTVADGAWHNVTVRRKATEFSLYLDGALQGTATVAAEDAIAQDADWFFGAKGDESSGFLGTGWALGQVRLYNSALPTGTTAQFGSSIVYTSSPVDPGAPTAYDPLPAAYGTEIAHGFAGDLPFSGSAIYAAANGDYYIVVEKGLRALSPERGADFYKSTNDGSTWALQPAMALDGAAAVSLFERGGALCAFGQTDAHTFKVWKWNAVEAKWDEAGSATGASDITYVMGQGLVCDQNNKITKAMARTAAVGCVTNGWVVFDAEGATFSNGTVMLPDRIGNAKSEWDVPTVTGLFGGHAFSVAGDELVHCQFAVSSSGSAARPDVPNRSYYSTITYVYKPEENPHGNRSNFNDLGIFRGGNAVFGLAKDTVGGGAYAVSTEGTNLIVQLTKDGRGWMPCGEIALPADGTVVAPSIAFSGDDLLVTYVVRRDDGAGGDALAEGGVYVAFNRIANVRTAYPPEEMSKRTPRCVYSLNEHGSFDQIWKASDGRWYQGKYFKKMYQTVGGTSLTSPMAVCWHNRRFYVTVGSSATMTVLNRDGKQLKTITMPSNTWRANVKEGHDGRLYLSNNGIYRLNEADDTWTTVVSQETLASYTGVSEFEVASDGRLFIVGSKDNHSKVYEVSADGQTWTQRFDIYAGYENWDSTSYAGLDEKGGKLYFALSNGKFRILDLSTGEIVDGHNYAFDTKSIISWGGFCDGKLLFYGNAGYIGEIDPATWEMKLLIHGSCVRGLTMLDAVPPGTLLFIR